MKNRIISLILAFVLVMGLTVPAFARESAPYNIDEYSDQKVFDGEVFSATQDFENIFVSDSGEYLMRLYASAEDEFQPLSEDIPEKREILVPVERFDVDFSDENSITSFSQLKDIPQLIVDDLKENYEYYLSHGDTGHVPHATLFAPYADWDDSETYYHQIDGFQMKSYQLYYLGQSTGWQYVKQGVKTKDVAKSASDVTVTAVSLGTSLFSKVVCYISSGISILQNFLNLNDMTQNQIVGSRDDYFQMYFGFDKVNQYTSTNYGNPGNDDYRIQLVTYKVNIKEIGSQLYFANTGELPSNTLEECDIKIESPDFDEPWELAFRQGRNDTKYEDITYETGGVTFTFER